MPSASTRTRWWAPSSKTSGTWRLTDEHSIGESGDRRGHRNVRGNVGPGGRAYPGDRPRGVRRMAEDSVRHEGAAPAQRGRGAQEAEGRLRAPHDARDGQADRPGRG